MARRKHPPEFESKLVVNVSADQMMNCVGDLQRLQVESSTSMVVRGIDIRKTEIHYTTMAADKVKPHRIVDYDIRSHGTTETTVEQAEELILSHLHELADSWETQQPCRSSVNVR